MLFILGVTGIIHRPGSSLSSNTRRAHWIYAMDIAVENVENTFRWMSFAGSVFLLVVAAGQLAIPNRDFKNIVYCVFYTSVGLVFLGNVNIGVDHLYVYPSLALLDIPAVYAIGPACYIIYKETIERKEQTDAPETAKRYVRMHLLIPFFTVGFTIPILFIPEAEKISYVRSALLYHETAFYSNFHLAGIVVTGIYALFILFRVGHIFTPRLIRDEPAVALLMVTMIVTFVAVIAATMGFYNHSYLGARFATALVSLFAFAVFILSFRFPSLIENYQIKLNVGSRKTSLSQDLNHRLKEGLRELMDTDRLYRREDLTLNMLSHRLDVSIYQLSHYLNAVEGQNFHSYVGRFRIEEAAGILLKQPDAKVITIAQDVGYSTLSSFNRMFKRIKGVSPSEFRQAHRGHRLS